MAGSLDGIKVVDLSRVLGGHAQAGDETDTPQWAEVRMVQIPVTVVAEGDLVAKDQVDIMNLIDHPDDETIAAIVEEGTWVEQGDWLYTLHAPGLVSDRDDRHLAKRLLALRDQPRGCKFPDDHLHNVPIVLVITIIANLSTHHWYWRQTRKDARATIAHRVRRPRKW